MELTSLSDNLDNSFKRITNGLLEVLKSIDRNYHRLSHFNAERALQIDSDKFNRRFYVAIREFRGEIEKALLPKKCIVFGETSAGKSALLNKIMNDELLLSSQGRTSICFVHIRRSLKDRYFVDQNDKDHNMDMWDEYITSESNDGSSVDVFMDKWPFEHGDITLIDSPGINVYSNIDENIVNKCRESSLIILVVDSTLTINKTMKEFIEKHKSTLTKLNIFFVINKWDKIKEKNRKRLQIQHSTDAMKILTSLGHSEIEAGERIFFLSSKDKPNSQFYEEDNKEFAKFLNKFKFVMEGKQMKLDLMEQIYKFVMEEFDTYQSVIAEMEEKILDITNQSQNRAESIRVISRRIKKEITETCKKEFENFVEESFKTAEDEITENNKTNKANENENNRNESFYKSKEEKAKLVESEGAAPSKISIKNGETNNEAKIRAEKIKLVFTKRIYKILEIVKSNFLKSINEDLIKKRNDYYLLYRLNAADNEYFPFEKLPLIMTCENEFAEKIMEIEDKKFKAKIGAIAGSATGLAVAAGTAGVVIAIVCPIAFGALAIAGIGAGAAATGTAVGGGLSTGIIKNIKNPFEFIQRKYIKPIEDKFDAFGNCLFEGYEIFLRRANENLKRAYQSLKMDDLKIQIENINEERNIFIRLCFIETS